ncbi:MAG: DNA translocase FtsK, partial [Beijerinckiaceae bacterium]
MRTTRVRAGWTDWVPDPIKTFAVRRMAETVGIALLAATAAFAAALTTWSVQDPSLNFATQAPVRNILGSPGAIIADLAMQLVGLGVIAFLLPLAIWGVRLLAARALPGVRWRIISWAIGVIAASAMLSAIPKADRWPLPGGLGGAVGDLVLGAGRSVLGGIAPMMSGVSGFLFAAIAILTLTASVSFAGAPAAPPRRRDVEPEMPSPKPQKAAEPDYYDRDSEPGFAIIWLGGIAHALLALKSALLRWLRRAFAHVRGRAADVRAKAAARRAEEEAMQAAAPPRTAQDADFRVVNEPRLSPPPSAYPSPSQGAPAPPVAPHVAPASPTHERREPTFTMPPANARYYRSSPKLDEFAASRVVPPAPEEPLPHSLADVEERQALAESFEDDLPVIETEFSVRDADAPRVAMPAPAPKPGKRIAKERQPSLLESNEGYELPRLTYLAEPKKSLVPTMSEEALEQNARLLESTLEDFGVRGQITAVRPGPVVTLYELEPAPGTKSSRVISLADDIARSMSAVSARVAVIQGKNAIGIELPNARRETVYLREMLASQDYESTKLKLALCLGKTIGGEPVIAELAKMPHVLVAGTTGSGKSVAINTMILSLVYRLKPEDCRLIMVDPKMLELSVYDGIPHLLTPVVTDPKKAVVALKWAVREMEDRYKKMAKLGVRNIDGFNTRIVEAKAKGEDIVREVQTGFDKETGEPIFTQENMALEKLPYIVVIVDEMADLMMVAGKEIEGAVQRLAQMARAAGIHVILATQRPSVDVITGTIKANFPTRISFQVTSKIDSRTILGEMGAEQLLGQGDMLYMAGGGRINRVHGPFVSDEEVERVVTHLKRQEKPKYLEEVTVDDSAGEEGDGGPVFDQGEFGSGGGDLFDQAVAVVLRDKKASTSYIQRRLQIGYNRAASLMERMEKEGIVGPANHAGKRDILIESKGGGGSDED